MKHVGVSRAGVVVASGLVALLLGGCAGAASDIAAGATPTAVRTGLAEMNKPESREQLQQLADSPVVRTAGQNLGQAVVKTGLKEANTDENKEQLQHLIDSPAFQHAGRAIGEGVGIGLFNQANQLTGGGATATVDNNAAAAQGKAGVAGSPHAATGPATVPTSGAVGTPAAAASPGGQAILGLAGGGGGLNGIVQSSIQQAFLAATDPKFKEGERALSEAVGEGFVQGMLKVANTEGPEIGETVRKQIGPIFQDIMREQIAPAIREMIQDQLAPAVLKVWRQGVEDTVKITVRPDIQPDVIQNAQNASIGASRGTHDALVNAGILEPAGGLTTHIKFFLWSGLVVGLLVVVMLVSLLVMLNLLVVHRWRRRRTVAATAG